MNIGKTLMAALMCVSMSAAAEMTLVDAAYEIALSNLTVPVSSSASLMFKECADCDRMTVHMNRKTRFLVNGKDVGLKKFRKSVYQIRHRDTKMVVIRHHLESDTITSVSVTLLIRRHKTSD